MFKVGDKVEVLPGAGFDTFAEDCNIYENVIYEIVKIDNGVSIYLKGKGLDWVYEAYRFKLFDFGSFKDTGPVHKSEQICNCPLYGPEGILALGCRKSHK